MKASSVDSNWRACSHHAVTAASAAMTAIATAKAAYGCADTICLSLVPAFWFWRCGGAVRASIRQNAHLRAQVPRVASIPEGSPEVGEHSEGRGSYIVP